MLQCGTRVIGVSSGLASAPEGSCGVPLCEYVNRNLCYCWRRLNCRVPTTKRSLVQMDRVPGPSSPSHLAKGTRSMHRIIDQTSRHLKQSVLAPVLERSVSSETFVAAFLAACTWRGCFGAAEVQCCALCRKRTPVQRATLREARPLPVRRRKFVQ